MSIEKSVTDVRIDHLIGQTENLSIALEKVAEGMATLLITTATNEQKHNSAEEFKQEAKIIFRDLWKEIKEIKDSISKLQKPIIMNSMVSNGVTFLAALLIGVIARGYFGG